MALLEIEDDSTLDRIILRLEFLNKLLRFCFIAYKVEKKNCTISFSAREIKCEGCLCLLFTYLMRKCFLCMF